jgi:hypothetical protein
MHVHYQVSDTVKRNEQKRAILSNVPTGIHILRFFFKIQGPRPIHPRPYPVVQIHPTILLP